MYAEVIVAGAGMTGLAAAAALARRGISVLVVEPRLSVPPDRWGLILWPSGVAALESIGVANELQSDVSRLICLRWLTESRDSWISVPLEHPLTFFGMRPSVLETALGSCALGFGARVLRGAKISRISRASSKRISVEITGEVNETVEGRLLLVADGPNSTLRDMLGLRAKRRFAERQVIFTTVAGGLPFSESRQFFGDRWSAGCVTLGAEHSWLYAISHDPRRDAMELLRRYSHLDPACSDAIESIHTLTTLHPASIRLKRWATDLGLVLGDAAHAMFPYLGFGGNASLEDVPIAAEAICQALKSSDNFDVLENVQRQRARRVTYLRRTSELFSLMLTSRVPGIRLIRDWNFNRLALRPDLLRRFFTELATRDVPSLSCRFTVLLP